MITSPKENAKYFIYIRFPKLSQRFFFKKFRQQPAHGTGSPLNVNDISGG